MTLHQSKRVLGSTTIAALAAVVIGACSSGGNGAQQGASQEAGAMMATHPIAHKDASAVGVSNPGPDASSAGTGTAMYDGTIGQPCMSNADCKGAAPDSPGVNVCSNTYLFTQQGFDVQLWPTPVCLVPLVNGTGNCDPGDENSGPQFCDGDPTDQTSPGFCVPNSDPPVAGMGNGDCYPVCMFPLDGSKPSGCTGNDTCNFFSALLDEQNNTVQGLGICQGTCLSDADCSLLGTTYRCQVDIGYCTTTKAKTTGTKSVGQACTNGATNSDSASGACYCPFSGSSTVTSFYCSQACVVGAGPDGGSGCPDGYVCDTFEPASLDFGMGPDGGELVIAGPAAQNTGMWGLCLAACSASAGGGAADAASDAAGDASSSQCPPNSFCTTGDVVGPDCQPPPPPSQ
jgi:hypothetical protein